MAQRFAVLSYNVQYDSPIRPRDAAGRIAAKDFQLAGFQEVFEPLGLSVLLLVPMLVYRIAYGHLGMRRALEEALRLEGFRSEWHGSSRPFLPIWFLLLGAQQTGLTASALEFPVAGDPVRFEIVGTDSRTLSSRFVYGIFGAEIRIAQYLGAILKPPPGEPNLGDLPLDFFNVHLTDRSPADRLAEIQELLDFVREKRQSSQAELQILVGDFNAKPGEPEIQEILNAGFVDVWAAVGAGPDLTSDARTGLVERIDYVFVNASALGPAPNLRLESAEVLLGEQPLISDHLGVRAVLVRG